MRPTIFILHNEPIHQPILPYVLVDAGHVVETFERTDLLLGRIEGCGWGCVVIDSKQPGKQGLEMQRAFRHRKDEWPLIFVSGHADIPTVVAAMKNGAVDFLTKPLEPLALLGAVDEALRKAEEAAARRAEVEAARKRWASLSPSERKACRFAAQGLLNKQLAAELGVTLSTAHAQRASGMRKLGISDGMILARLLDLIGDAD